MTQEINSFIIQNNLRTFTDLMSGKPGKESISWLLRKTKKHNSLIDIKAVEYLYYYDGVDDMPYYDINSGVSVLPKLKEALKDIITFSEAIFKKYLKFDDLITLIIPEEPFTKLITFNITPIGKPTWQKSDRWASRPARDKYLAYKEHLQLLANQARFVLPEQFHVTFFRPIPKSFSKKKKIALHNQPCGVKYDASNMLKGLEDILLPDGDEKIWDIRLTKRYTIGNGDGTGGYILIEY